MLEVVTRHNHLSVISSRSSHHEDLRLRLRVEEDENYALVKSSFTQNSEHLLKHQTIMKPRSHIGNIPCMTLGNVNLSIATWLTFTIDYIINQLMNNIWIFWLISHVYGWTMKGVVGSVLHLNERPIMKLEKKHFPQSIWRVDNTCQTLSNNLLRYLTELPTHNISLTLSTRVC